MKIKIKEVFNVTIQEQKEAMLQKERYGMEDLRTIVQILRSEEGCPWDREQDHHSIRSSLIEEAYEVIEAIDTENKVLLQEELGDLLLQIVFHAQIEQEKECFSMDEVTNDICVKMIHRHPHVFSTVKVKDSAEVLSNWEAIKTEEKQRNTLVDKLKAIPPMLPALMRASKVAKKAGVTAQQTEETLLATLEAQVAQLHQSSVDSTSIGDVLMTIAQLSQLSGVDAEHALSLSTDRLILEVEEKH